MRSFACAQDDEVGVCGWSGDESWKMKIQLRRSEERSDEESPQVET
jgi:hypothetical protein